MGKEKKGGLGREAARPRKKKRERGGEEREREGGTRHTSPSLLPALLTVCPKLS